MLDNTMRERWRYYLKRRLDQNGDDRRDIWIKGVRQLRRMKIVSGDERPAPFGAPAPTVFAGVTWVGIGPQPLRIDKDQKFQGSGPASGEVVDIAIDPSGAADTVIYVATNNGGVWKSINGGATWTPKTDFMPSLSMGSIEIDPVDHQIIYAGTGNNFDGGRQGIRGAGIYRSIDAGDTWTVLGSSLFTGLLITRISIPATNVLLVATNNGLFRSVDGGQSFGANAPDFNDGLPVRAGFFTDLQLDTANSATVYACRRGSGILRSTDGGSTFPTDLFANPGAPAIPFDFITFAQSTSPDNQVLYALVTDASVAPPGAKFKGLFRSPDRGATWTLMPGAAGPAAENKGLQNGYDVTVAVDPKDPNRVYIGFQELYLSTDGGLNFGTPAISANLVHFDNHVTVFTPHGPAAAPTPFYTGTDGGIARNDDGNTAWTNLNETIATNLILGMDIGRNSAANNAFTYAGCQDTGTIERRPPFTGNDWHLGIDGDGTRVVVDPNNPQRAFARDNQFLIFTIDGGTNWTFPTSASTGLPDSGGFSVSKPMGIDPNTSAVVYVALDKQLFISTDSGATFTVMHTFLGNVSCLETTKLDSKILMVGCEDGTVHRTTNADAGAGSNWVPVTINDAPVLIVSAIAMDPTDNKSAVVTYSGFSGVPAGTRSKHVFASADVANVAMEDISGTDGASPDANVPDLPVHAVIWDPSTVPHSIIIGCDTDVLRSTDGGASWHIYGAGIPNADCTQLAADYTLSPPLIRAGTYGRSAFELVRPSGPNIVVRSNLAFGGVATGGSTDVDFEIFNVGDANLTITDISDPTANPNFALVTPPGFPFDIAPGNLATLTLRFSPTAPGKQITAYSIACNDPTHPLFGLPVSGLAAFTGPQVTSLIPAAGPPAGGTAVQVRGSVLTGATAVNFGTTAASGMTVDSDTQISCVSPAGTGTVTVSVVTPAGTTAANPAAQFTYSSSGIVVTGLNPVEGPETGGTSVIISGAGFTGATQVLFGGFAATGFTVDNASQVTAVSPAGTGTVDVLVATPAGTSGVSPAAKFRYQAPAGGVATGGGGTGTGTDTGGGGGEELVMSALADILRSGTDPEVLEAQRILLRRIALEGNIVDSRIPAPKNITEVGGYVNLLTTLGHTDIRTQMLASALGVAGPATPIGLSGEGAPLAFINLANDRPQGPAQPTFATTFTVRSDLADATAQALQRIRGAGCALPLSTPPRVLPAATPGRVLQPDLLVLLGRVLQVAPSALLSDPSADPVAIARRETDPPDRWQLVAREIDGESRVAFASWLAYQATDTNIAIMPPAQRQYLPIAQILADAGWYPTEPFAAPASIAAQGSLPRLLNVTGLVRGQTLLGDELLLLYARPTVMASALAGMMSWIWNGTAFVPPLPPIGP
jgi:hypothetical protein